MRRAEKMKNRGKPTPLGLVWLAHFLSEEGGSFLNATMSARRAGYKARNAHSFQQIGFRNKQRYGDRIAEWFQEKGYSENELKIKLLRLLEAKQTVHLKLRGAVLQSSLPEGCRVLTTSGTIVTTKDGQAYGDGDTLLAIDVQVLETQRKTLDMALKMKGLYAAEKHEHSGAIATVTELTEKDRQLARDLVSVGIQKLMEAQLEKPA